MTIHATDATTDEVEEQPERARAGTVPSLARASRGERTVHLHIRRRHAVVSKALPLETTAQTQLQISTTQTVGHFSPARGDNSLNRRIVSGGNAMTLLTANISTNVAAGLLTLLMAVSLTACSTDSEPAAIPEAQDPTTSASPSTPQSSQAPAEPSWEDDFTDKQLAKYENALQAWTQFEGQQAAILEAGKATPAARALYERTYPSPLWQRKVFELEAFEDARIKYTGMPTVFWSQAARVKGQSVTIEQCVDYTTRVPSQAGKKAKWQRWLREPVIRSVELGRIPDLSWLVYQSDLPTKKTVKPCTGDES